MVWAVPPVRNAIAIGLSRPRDPAIEGFRGVVVTAVVGYHLLRLLLTLDGGSWGSETTPWLWWAGTARFAVDAFFVLAGMFVTASWLRARRAGGSRWAAAVEYARRRARRILPPFWAAAAVLGGWALLEGRVDLAGLALLATTQQYLDPELTAEVALPMWSLTTEVQFYVVAPLVAVAARRLRGVPLLAATVALSAWWLWWPERPEDLAAGLLPGRLVQFAAGAVVGVLVQRARDGERPVPVRLVTTRGVPAVLVAALVALGTFHGATFQADAPDHALEHWTTSLSALLLGGIVLRLAAGAPVRPLAHPVWRFLGMISYGLYLWHYPLLDRGMDWFGLRDGGPRPAPAIILAAVVLVAAAVAVAVAAFVLVEAPLARRASAVRQPELRLQDPVEVPAAEPHEVGVVRGRRADDRVALPQLAPVAAVDRQGRGAVAQDLEADLDVGGDDHRPVEQHVR